MKCIVKNNRLGLEEVNNLSTIAEQTLIDLAAKYNIGASKGVEVSMEVRGKIRKQLVFSPKPRQVLEQEVRNALSITLDIPRELWSEAQEYEYNSKGVEDLKDITTINDIKMSMGVLYNLLPWEEGLSNIAMLGRVAEITKAQADYFVKFYNVKYSYEKDEKTGEKKTRVSAQKIFLIDEWIPEPGNEDDIAWLAKESRGIGATKKLKESAEKYGKNKDK